MNIRSMKNILSQSQARAGEGAKKNVSEPTEFCMEEKDPLNKESNPVLPRTRQRRVGLMHYTEEEPEEKQEKETFVCNSCSSKVVCGWCENCGDVSYDYDSADDAAEAQSGSAISTPSPIDTDEPSDQNSPHGTRDGSKALSGVLRNATDVRGKKKKKVSWCKGQAGEDLVVFVYTEDGILNITNNVCLVLVILFNEVYKNIERFNLNTYFKG